MPRRARPRPALGHAEHDRVLDRRDLLDPQPDRRRRAAVPAGTRSATSAAVPTDSRGTTTRPASSAASSTTIAVEAVADLERHAPRGRPRTDPAAVRVAELEARPAEDERPMGVVLELVLGVDPAADPDVARPARRPSATRLGDADRAASTASSRPTR